MRVLFCCVLLALSACGPSPAPARTPAPQAAPEAPQAAPEPAAETKPCELPEYVQIKPRPLRDMSEREFDYFLKTVSRLNEAELAAFRARDYACAQQLAQEARAKEEADREEADRVRKTPTPPHSWAILMSFLAAIASTVLLSLR